MHGGVKENFTSQILAFQIIMTQNGPVLDSSMMRAKHNHENHYEMVQDTIPSRDEDAKLFSDIAMIHRM